MRTCFSNMAVLLVLIAIGCAPIVDLEAERASVLETDKEWASAMVAKDLDRAMSFVADDATLFPPDAPILEGKRPFATIWLSCSLNQNSVLVGHQP